MKYSIAIISCSVFLLAAATNLSSAQPKKAEASTVSVTALVPEPPEPPATPEPFSVAVANFDEGLETYQLLTGVGGQGGSVSGTSRALVIPKEAGDAKEFGEIEEDLSVMARILEKAASGRDDKRPQAMGIAIQTTVYGTPSMPRNLYIEGHGAVFFMNANFPLLPPAKSPEAEPKEKTSTEWEEARRELYQPRGSGFEFNWRPATAGSPAEKYDAERVEDLKRDVTAALKNATHIRGLKSDETITVVISGRSGSGESKSFRKSGGSGTWSSSTPRVVAVAKNSGGENRGTKLILRARKADIDSFQKDKLNPEDFRKKVTMIVY